MSSRRKLSPITIALIIFVCALIPRIFLLGQVPTGISNDELDYVINAKTFFLTGHGLTGSYSPIRLTANFPNAELSSILISPIIGPFPFSLLTTRIPFALISAGSILVLYFLGKTLIGERGALYAAMLAIINPWNIFFSRTTYDAPVATFFFLLGFLLLLQLKGWRVLLALIPLLIGFHTYMGTMVLFPPMLLTFLLSVRHMTSRRQSFLPATVVFVVCLVFVVRYVLSLSNAPASVRLSELVSPFHPSVAEKVDVFRRAAVAHPLVPLFVNKATVFFDDAITTYAGAFSPQLLFVYGDSKHIFTLFYHGLFYLSDALFILVGFVVLFQKNRKVWIILLALLLIAPLPSVASSLDDSYASRSYFMQPLLLLFAGIGLSYVMEIVKKQKSKRLLSVAVVMLYIVQVARFGTVYFLRNTINNSESYNFSARVMARFVRSETSGDRKVLLLAGEPRTPLKHYAFYTNAITLKNVRTFMDTFQKGIYRIGNVQALQCPSAGDNLDDTTLIVEGNLDCPHFMPSGNPRIIAQLSDGGSVYKIFNGQLCKNEKLERYPHDIHFSDFTVEPLSDQSFCRTFITTYEEFETGTKSAMLRDMEL